MKYRYCERTNFEDFSSGRVFYHGAGITNFPVRLVQEIFSRCLSYIENKGDVCIYDPCCGGGYLLTVLGFLNPELISVIIGSDINKSVIEIAAKNLGLLFKEGIDARIGELRELHNKYNKSSHLEALESAGRFASIIQKRSLKMKVRTFQADILADCALMDQEFKADIVITDVPYGNLVSWEGQDNMIGVLLKNIRPILKRDSVVAVCSTKRQKINVASYLRLEKQDVGKRKFEILRMAEN